MPDPQLELLRKTAGMRNAQAKSTRRHAACLEGRAHRERLAAADRLTAEASAMYAELNQLENDRARDIRLINVPIRDRQLDEETKRALYCRVTSVLDPSGGPGTDSLADMTAAERLAVYNELKRLGFRPKQKGQRGRKPKNISYTPADLRAKVEAQLADMGLPWGYAVTILRRNRGLPDDKKIEVPIDRASPKELQSIIAALHVEQEKRQLLAEIDAWLDDHGQTRADLANRMGLKNDRWQRNRTHLRAIYESLYGRQFRLKRGRQ